MSIRNGVAAALGLLWTVSCVCAGSSARAQQDPTAQPAQAAPVVVPPRPVVADLPRVPSSETPPAAAPPQPAQGLVQAETKVAEARIEPVIALRVEPGLVAPDALRVALENELGVRIADAAVATAGMPTLSVVRLPSGNVEVALSSRSLLRASRELALTAERPEERVETVALIAANLVRNEAAALLPDLRPIESSAPVAPSAPPAVKIVSPCDVRGEAVFGIDLAPGVGASSTRSGRNATRRVSLGLAGTLSARLHGLGYSLGANIQKVSVCGAQIANGANISAGPVQGLQLAVFNLARYQFVGAQGGVLNIVHGDFQGLQAGVVTLVTGSFSGAQGAVANYIGGDQQGVQYGVVTYIGGNATGAQGGVANFTLGNLQGLQAGVANLTLGSLNGLQAGVANLAEGRVDGMQAGVGNYAGGVHGPQLGVVNVSSGAVKGVQIGVFNYADSSTASIGVLSIVRRGRTSIDALGAVESGILLAGITHGSKYVHNSYAIGVRTGSEGQHLVASLALGVRFVSTARLRVDLDAFGIDFIGGDLQKRNTSVNGLRVPITVMLVKGFGVVAAPSYQVMITDDPEARTQSIVGEKTLYGQDQDDLRVLGYPGLTLGLRYEFDHGA